MKQVGLVLLGVVVGWGLKIGWDWRTARRERERQAAEQLNDALSDVWQELQGHGTLKGDTIAAQRDRFRRAWWRYGPRVRSTEVRERVRSAGRFLWLVPDMAEVPRIRASAVDSAIRNAQQALTASIEHRRLPPTCFPAPEEVQRLFWGADTACGGAKALLGWLNQHPHAPIGRRGWEASPDDAPAWSWMNPRAAPARAASVDTMNPAGGPD
jgi:hypothetical protein